MKSKNIFKISALIFGLTWFLWDLFDDSEDDWLLPIMVLKISGVVSFILTAITLIISIYKTFKLIIILRKRKLFGRIVNKTRVGFAIIAINIGIVFGIIQGINQLFV